ncbi:Bestrophin, RFP-TM, chloride channel-domain-containing protein [Mycena rebaudengoi]|nr:Bestrophin, RFP-TM, chloride channel-domain-containing protein [Mycena rebaudengoi]
MSAAHHIRGKRSFTGNHSLLPATHPPSPPDLLPNVPSYTFVTWTFGRGSVISKIWPAMLLHTLFAAGVVYVWFATGKTLGIPNVMLTVLGVVIGFVISYRASTSYDRYWTGRTAWSDVVRNTRTLGRMIWYHIPLRLSSRLHEEPIGARRSEAEMKRVMHEKKMALDLVEGFAVALKHHLRNEQGIYYEDLYDLIKPLHDHYHSSALSNPLQEVLFSPTEHGAYGTFAAAASTLRATSHASKRPANPLSVSVSTPQIFPLSDPTTAGSTNAASSSTLLQTSENPSLVSLVDAHTPLLPASNPGPEGSAPFRRVAPDIIPLAGHFANLRRAFRSNSTAPDTPANATGEERDHRRTWRGPVHPEKNARRRWKAARERNTLNARVARLVYEGHDLDALAELRRDTQPDDEAGENLPAEILRCLSEWVAVLEERGSAPSQWPFFLHYIFMPPPFSFIYLDSCALTIRCGITDLR